MSPSVGIAFRSQLRSRVETATQNHGDLQGNGSKKMNLWWVLVVVNAALAVWAGVTSNLVRSVCCGSMQPVHHPFHCSK